MREYDNLCVICHECGKHMVRDMRADLFNTPNDSYTKPLHSDALAIAPSQRKEHEQKFPYIKLDKKCRPIFDN